MISLWLRTAEEGIILPMDLVCKGLDSYYFCRFTWEPEMVAKVIGLISLYLQLGRRGDDYLPMTLVAED